MPEIGFPLSTAPGILTGESGGRLINAYAEKAAEGSRSEFRWGRAPGLIEAFTTNTSHRGGILVGSVAYIVSDDTVYSVTKSAGAYTVTALTGTVGGTGPVFMARNMAATPEILIVHSDGMSEIDISGSSVASFSDADLPAVNSICWLDGYFIVTSLAGKAYASGLNATTFAATDNATAEADPDGLVRALARNRDLLLMGVSTTEFWSNVGNPTGFPFRRSTVIPYGLFGPYAVAGQEPGWGHVPIFVANDRSVRMLQGYDAAKISEPDLDALLEQVEDPTDLEASVYVSRGHPHWALSSSDWTWVFDRSTGKWHERKSYGADRWRARQSLNAFDEWLTFDRDTNKVWRIDSRTKREGTAALVWEARSVQQHAFPSRMEVNRIAFDFLVGVGNDAGINPIETNPRVLISWSDDGGRTFGTEVERELGTAGEMVTAQVYRTGTTGTRGRQYRIRASDPVDVTLLGGAWDGQVVQ